MDRSGREAAEAVWGAVVVAAGGASRYGGRVPKQFLPLDGVPVVEHSLRTVLSMERVSRVVLVVPAESDWRRDQVAPVFAGADYLRHWAGPSDLGDADPDAPVTHVSWFAAAAYCDAHGLRLPSQAEWEVAARADATRADASSDPERRDAILASLSRMPTPPGPVGQDEPTVHGVHDLHGLVWEWVEDPWTQITSGDSRNAGDRDVARVCGGPSLGARDRSDYPAFLRHAVRLGQTPAGVGASLGFRCAR